MTDLRTAAQQALDACTDAVSGWQSLAPLAVRRAAEAALDDLRVALAEPENWELRRLREELERCKQTCAATSEAWREEAALAEPVQEPVAWLYRGNLHATDPSGWCIGCPTPLYTAPPQRKPLTEEEIEKLLIEHAGMTVAFSEVDLRFARAIERAHGIGGRND